MACQVNGNFPKKAGPIAPSRGTLASGLCQARLGLCCLLAAVLLAAAGCRTPISADCRGYQAAYRAVGRSALDSSRLSIGTMEVLHRCGVEQKVSKAPAEVLNALHVRAMKDGRRDLLCALAELSYWHADRLRRSSPEKDAPSCDYHLASAIYAWLFLFGDGPDASPNVMDPRYRLACELYNRALAQGLRRPGVEPDELHLAAGERALPPGRVRLTLNLDRLGWKPGAADRVLPADQFVIRGLSTRHRMAGLGAALILVRNEVDLRRFPQHAPATAILRVNGDLQSWGEGQLTASVELYSGYQDSTVRVGEAMFPLENDPTAALAYSLNEQRVWKLGKHQFFSSVERVETGIYPDEPYERGRVPVVFVHGTFSSPVGWAEMWNSLKADPLLRSRFQFWCFIYNSGRPVSDSACRLSEALQARVAELDPQGKDPALRHIVVIGHSQGGLLAKLAATDTGDALWRTVTTNDLEQLKCSPEVKGILRRNFFFTRLPCVDRVVFIATPHRGSYLAGRLVRRVARWFVSLPKTVIATPAHWLSLRKELGLPANARAVVPSSLDGMSPKDPWLLALADLPTAPEVRAHSIIAIKGNEQPPEGADGVVSYRSAHINYVESEKVIRAGHSCQNEPAASEEARRILLLHLEEMRATAGIHAATEPGN